MDKILNTKEAAAMLGLSAYTTRMFFRDGSLKGFKTKAKARWRTRERWVKDFIKSRLNRR